MKKKLLTVSFALFFFIVSFNQAKANIHTITVQDFNFSPSSLSGVQVGDIIRWVWVNGSHTTTSTSVPSGAAAWDSPMTSSVDTFEYTVTTAGTYNYVCTPHSPNMAGSFTATETTTTSVKTNSQQNFLNTFPNPVTNVLIIKSSDNSEGNIKIIGIEGKTLKSIDINGSFEVTVDMIEFPAGLYFVELNTRKGRITKKIVKK